MPTDHPYESAGEAQPPRRIGLLAGGGRFPVLVAQALRRQGIEIVCAALRHEAEPELGEICQTCRFFGLGRLGPPLRFFKKSNISALLVCVRQTFS